jgi:WD40 repeat protein
MEHVGNHLSQKPVIFLAFANDRVDDTAYLRNLPKELNGIRNVLQKAGQHGLCELVERSNATIENILDVFQDDRYHDRIAIFHYGGHASSYQLLLETIEGGHAAAYREGLVSFLAKQKGLKLVFLNGCSSQQHALDLVRAGIPAVIGTSQSINDEVATTLSIRFYNGIANSFTIERAWGEAVDDINTRKGTSTFRELYWQGKKEVEDRFPWDIFYKKGGEKVKSWNLAEAANDPLFGLPEIPGTYGLPEIPFLFLDRYERKHAKIFFGRSVYIRELYNRIIDTKSPPIILLYGQSGVGKSSLLDAGLMPRIEESHTVLYIRRDRKKGLVGSLKESLQRNFSNIENLSLVERWKQIESQTGKPLVIILDQVEEVYTGQNKDLPNEINDFMEIMKKLFGDPALYPGGKLILGYRKEYHPEIDKVFSLYELPRVRVFLEPLTRRDIMEVVTGLTQTSELMQRYNIKVDKDLPVIIADDLLEDKNSSVAPVLQILLTKMWKQSKKDEFSPTGEFTVEQYRELQRQGIAMKDFFQQQMEKLKDWKQEVVDSGLALDLLKYHTTELGTACSRSIEELGQTYGNMADILDELIKKLKQFYLLTEAQHGKADSSLAHDILAPVVIKEYTDSDKPGQRAARILTSKIEDFKKEEKGIWLDEADLRIVEEGRKGMRALDEIEKKLVEISREHKAQREREKKRIKKIGVALIAIIFITAILALWQWQTALEKAKIAKEQKERAEKNFKISQANYLVSQAQIESKEDPTIALRIAEQAWHLDKNDTVTEALHKIYRENYFYKIIIDEKYPIGTAAFSPGEKYILTAFEDRAVRLWDLGKKEFKIFSGHKDEVLAVTFSPDEKYILIGCKDGTVRLLDLRGSQIKSFMHGGAVNSVSFSPDGKYILSGSNDKTARLWDLESSTFQEFAGHTASVTCAVFSPDGKYIITGSDDKTARLWEVKGTTHKTLNKHENSVTCAAFSPNGQYIITGCYDRMARLWDWETDKVTKLMGHKSRITSVVFSPDGNYILTGSMDKTARLWDLAGNELQVLTGHKEGVFFVAFSSGGKYILTGSYDGIIRLWDMRRKELQFFKHVHWLTSVAISPDGKYILTGSNDKARLWDLQGKEIRVFNGHEKKVTSVAFSPDGNNILTGSGDNTARLWDMWGKTIQVFQGHEEGVTSAVFSPDSSCILTGSGDTTARLWDLKGNIKQVFKGHEKEVTSAIFSPDGRFILTGSGDNTARLWDIEGKTIQVFKGHEKVVKSVAFSPDGNTILTGSEDTLARLWDLKGNVLQVFRGHNFSVWTAVFSPDGKFILTGSRDRTACLWDLKELKLQVFKRHQLGVTSAAFFPDGKHILTGSRDNTACLWEIGMPVEDYLKEGDFEELSKEQLKKYGIQD